MKKTTYFLFAVILALSLISSQATAFLDRGPQFRHRFIEDLGLSQEQMKNFLNKEQEINREIFNLRQDNEKLRYEMFQELKKDKPEKAKLDSLIDKIEKNNATIYKKRADLILWLKSQLNAEQRQKFDSLQNNFGVGIKRGKGFRR